MFKLIYFCGQLHRSLGLALFFAVLTSAHVNAQNSLQQTYSNPKLNPSDLPFWPDFPENLKIQPTHIDIQHLSGLTAGVKITGEGPGFTVIASSEKSMIFATPPRLAPAWQVECQWIGCDLTRITTGTMYKTTSEPNETEQGLGRAAYQAALTFVANYTGFDEKMASRQIEPPVLPPLKKIQGDSSKVIISQPDPLPKKPTKRAASNFTNDKSLLQGFR